MPAPRKTRHATGADAIARILLDRLGGAIDEELQRRRIAAELEPAGVAPVDIDGLSSISRDLPRLAGHAARAVGAASRLRGHDVARGIRGVADFLTIQADLAGRRARGEAATDDFGFDREWTEAAIVPLMLWVYRHWWRVQVRGIANVPTTGRALLVSNHAGVVPYDGAMIRLAVFEELGVPRHVRALVLDGLFGTPVASWLVRRTGNTLAHNADADTLLRRDEAVLVFPEGTKGPGKPYRDRYRLRRFGRGGFVELALRTGSPIIPVSVVGSEEIHPMLADLAGLAKALGQPYLPITPTLPWLGPLGLVPLPSSWIIEFHEPVDLRGYDADSARDPGTVMRIADAVRDTIQAGVWGNLERRGSVFAVS